MTTWRIAFAACLAAARLAQVALSGETAKLAFQNRPRSAPAN
jgi:hypothetical protein